MNSDIFENDTIIIQQPMIYFIKEFKKNWQISKAIEYIVSKEHLINIFSYQILISLLFKSRERFLSLNNHQ